MAVILSPHKRETMSRDKRIRVSEDEHELLSKTREQIYGTDEVPYGTVVQRLCEDVVIDKDK